MQVTSIIYKLKKWNKTRKFNRAMSVIHCYRNIEGWLSEKEAYGLYSTARKVKKHGVIVEIGSWKGKSTYCLAKGLKDGTVFSIDPFNADGESGSKEDYDLKKGGTPLINQFISEMEKCNVLHKIEVLKGYSKDFIDFQNKIDFLFIDGDHSIEGCDFDFIQFSPKIKRSGYIAFHDYDPKREELGPTWVINNRIKNNPQYLFINMYDTLWIAQKL